MIAGLMSIVDKLSMTFGKNPRAGLISINANVNLDLFDSNGLLIDNRFIKNTVTSAGKYGAAEQLLASPALPKAGWMEVGTGTGGTTTLNAYIANSRTAVSSVTRNNAIVSYPCTFGAGVGTGAITECGLFDVVTQNTANMWLYSSFTVINKAAGDSLVITWTLTYG
jgi:hypothetical protein